MTNKHVLFCLVLDRFDRENHADILALLEGDLCEFELNEFEALLAKNFEELHAESVCNTGYFNCLLELVASEVLKEVSEVTFI